MKFNWVSDCEVLQRIGGLCGLSRLLVVYIGLSLLRLKCGKLRGRLSRSLFLACYINRILEIFETQRIKKPCSNM